MRTVLTLLLVTLLAAPATAKGLVIVMNSGDASLSILDEATGAELRRVPVLREPHHNTLSPDGKSLLVGDSGGNEMLLLDPATGEIRRRVPMADPYHLQFSPDGRYLTVTGLARNQVDIYDAHTLQLVKRFPARSMPSHIAYAPDSSMAFVTLQGTNKLVAFDLTRMEQVWLVDAGNTPAGVLWHRGQLLVADMGADGLSVIDPATGDLVRRVKTGRGAHQVFLSPDAKTIWVNNRVDGTTAALDPDTLALRRLYRVGGGPDDIDFAPDGKLWITERFAQKVAVLDPASGDVVTYPVGRSPHGIFLSDGLRDRKE